MEEKLGHGQRGTVLLAEDDVLIRMPVAQYLRDCGYRVLEAVTTGEALEALEDERFDISAVVSSVQLAGDGFGISSWVRQRRPDLKVILTGTPARAVEAVSGLCDDETVSTPLAPQLLLRRIRQTLANRKRPSRKGRTAI